MRRIVDYPRAGKQGWRRFLPSWKLVLGSGLLVFLLGAAGFFVLYASVDVPDPNKLVTANASVVYWSDGKTELGRFGDVNRRSIPLSQTPDALQKAVLAAEDRSFYDNLGFSPRGIGRAVWVKVRGGSTQGGSTITQQYVKNYFLTQDRTATRKAKEFVISLKVEQVESKDKILENYLNTIYFGRGAFGVETASRAYFGRSAKDLTLAQSALLAAIIRSPGLYDPVANKQNAQARMDYVLDGMVSQGWLTQADRDAVKFPKIAKRDTDNRLGGTNGYLLKTVRQEVVRSAGLTDADIDRGGLKIVSTFDRRSQSSAVAAMKDEMPTTGAKGVSAGLVAIKPGDGAVVAMYGGPDAVKREYNAATQAVMQAGSTFKPFALAAALEDGMSLRSRYNGRSPQTFGSDYEVSNFGNEQFGTIDLLTATANSVNTVYVQLNQDVGPKKTVEAAIAAGYPKTTLGLVANTGNVLGTSSPRVIDVADAYATFAAQGVRTAPYTVRSVTLANGDQVYKAQVRKKRAFDTGAMADLTYALQGVVQRGSGAYAGSNLGRPAAGKTGTSQASRSAWFAGYTPQLATAVGMYRQGAGGRVESLSGLGGRSNVTGGSFPVRIWTAFMKAALEGQRVEQFPEPVFGGKVNVPTPTSTGTSTSTPTITQTPTGTPTGTPSKTPPPSTTSTTSEPPDPCSVVPLPDTCPPPPSPSPSPPPSTPAATPSRQAGDGPTR